MRSLADTHKGMRSLRILSAIALTACSGVIAPPAPTIPGRYELETVNGGRLPAVLAVVPPEVIRLRRASIVLFQDSTFVDSQFVESDRTPFGPVTVDTIVFDGTYRVDGCCTVTMVRSNGAVVTVAWDDAKLIRFLKRDPADLVLVYRAAAAAPFVSP